VLEFIKERSLSSGESPYEFFKWALREAKMVMPECTILFMRLEQFSPVYRPLGAKSDPWVNELVATVKQSIRNSGYSAFGGFCEGFRIEDDICSSQMVPVVASSSPAGILIFVSRCPGVLKQSDRLFNLSLAQVFENVLERTELQTLSRMIPNVIRAKQQWERVVDGLGQCICLLNAAGRTLRVNRKIEEWQLGTVQAATGQSIHELFHRGCSDGNCQFLSSVNKGWTQMLDEGEALWETAITEISGYPLRFRLQRAGTSGSPALPGEMTELDANTFALLTVRPYFQRQVITPVTETMTRRVALDAKVNERQRIAHELHDGIGQSLAVVKFSLESLKCEIADTFDRQAVGQIDKVLTDLRASMEDLHRLSADLNPRYLGARSLPDALRLLCEDLACTYTNVVFDCDVSSVSHDVSKSLKLAIFRVAQEALSNALKHSEANTISLSLRRRKDALTLEVTDNGIGFDVDRMLATGAGQGVVNMRQRAQQSDGSVSIRARPNRGSTISATWLHSFLRLTA